MQTAWGRAILADAAAVLPDLPAASVRLVLSSPPFALDANECDAGGPLSVADWLVGFLPEFQRVLGPGGSLVLELGAAWAATEPRLEVEPFDFIVRACRQEGWKLLQVLYWYNPQLLKDPDSERMSRTTRFRESVSPIWWLARSCDVRINAGGEAGIESASARRANLLAFGATDDDARYQERCARHGVAPHFDPFPASFPRFFISLLTAPGDLVLDPFAGSCTTGAAAEGMERRWVCIERRDDLLSSAPFRFHLPTRTS